MDAETIGLKKRLPHGAMREIAALTGLSPTTISQVINGHVISTKQPEILKATANVLTKYKEKKADALNALSQALQTDI